MAELSLDITEEILVRSDAKDLIQYKIICKSWNSLISSGCFIKSHLNYTLKKQADNNEIGHTRLVLSGPSRRDCDIVGSSNGLVCLRFDTELLVVNPLTHQLIKLKSLPQIPDLIKEFIPRMGFGYDSSIDDYKVVIGFRNTCTGKYRFLVLTLKLNVWRSVLGEFNYRFLGTYGILYNGAIYWHYYRKFELVIASFDLSKEVFKKFPSPLIPSPVLMNNVPTYKLGTTKDRLCFFCGGSRYYHKLWVKKNYNVQESESIWEQMLPPSPYDDCPHQTNTNHIPCKSFSVFVQRVESPHAHIWLSTISERNYNYDEHVFVESLVSPHVMGNDNGNCNEERVTMAMEGDSNEKKGTETNSNKTSMGEKCKRQRRIYKS